MFRNINWVMTKGAFFFGNILFKYSIFLNRQILRCFFMFFIINSLLQFVQANRTNIDTHNLANCSILPYSISTSKIQRQCMSLGPKWRWRMMTTLNKTNFASKTIQAQSCINTWAERSSKNWSYDIKLVATKMDVILRRLVVLKRMHDKR